MSFWFRDIIAEGTVYISESLILKTAKAIPKEEIKLRLDLYNSTCSTKNIYKNNPNLFGYYLSGLLLHKFFTLFGLYAFKGLYLPITVSKISIRKRSFRAPKNSSTDLVIWGENMYSGFNRLKLSSVELNMYKLPQYQRSIIVGLLLSDGWLSYASVNNKYPRLGFEQTSLQASYVWLVYWSLSHYCYSLPKFTSRTRYGLTLSSWSFSTRSLPCLVEIYNSFYINNKKVIPDNIFHILTPVALAHLIMGDGSSVSGGLRISTDDFTVIDVIRLINVLIIKYRLKCSLHINNHRPRIYIHTSSMGLLKSIVDPYIVPSMKYKLIPKTIRKSYLVTTQEKDIK